jgi:hypothetical protein
MGVVFPRRTTSKATARCVLQPRHLTSRYRYPALSASPSVGEGWAGPWNARCLVVGAEASYLGSCVKIIAALRELKSCWAGSGGTKPPDV